MTSAVDFMVWLSHLHWLLPVVILWACALGLCWLFMRGIARADERELMEQHRRMVRDLDPERRRG